MKSKLLYRTYIIRLWLSAMAAAPLAFVFIVFIIDSNLFSSDYDGPLQLAIDMILLLIFIVPTFLFFVILSFIIPKVTQDPMKLKKITIIVSVLAALFTFISFYDSEWYNKTQLAWGMLLAIIYCACLIFLGTIYKVSD
ncbi:MAG TPA: hypothetical protein VF487_02330 [Chitinophagaceae bacterium]